ncbi:MAG: hypothetical protein HZA51_18230 [Planctomycetes bacterium]|nr:hypothetical protein [Planctomycetota bacterium]
MPCIRSVLCCALISGCACQPSTVPDPPGDELAKQSIQQAADSNQQISHLTRLRDIDRMRHAEEISDLTGRIDALRGICVMLAFALTACCVWLAVEIRRRRVLAIALQHVAGDPHTAEASATHQDVRDIAV